MFYFLISLALIAPLDGAKRFAGPYNVVIREPSESKDRGTNQISFTDLVVRKTGKTSFTISTVYKGDIPFSDDLKMVVSLSAWGNGGWKPNFLTIEGKACSMLKEKMPLLFDSSLKAQNLTSGECPRPAASYKWNVPTGVHQISSVIPSLPYNKYEAHSDFMITAAHFLGALVLLPTSFLLSGKITFSADHRRC